MPKKVRRAAAITMNEAMKAKRQTLAQLSRSVKAQIESGEIEAATINEGLIEIYSEGQELEYNTFKQWKEKGFSIKKGSHAHLVWGKPRQVPVVDSDKENDEFKYWPVCYLFSENQVEKKVSKEVAL